jgi:hypothetical protein
VLVDEIQTQTQHTRRRQTRDRLCESLWHAHDSALASIIESSRSSVSTTRSLPPSNSATASAHANSAPSNNKHELASPPPATRHLIQSLPSKVEPEQEETQDPPPFASHNFPTLYFPPEPPSADVQAAPPPDFEQGPSSSASSPFASVVEATKAALPQDTKPRSDKAPDNSEPPPPYTEGASPLDGFTYLMAQAGGAASIITQVSQGGPAPLNTNQFHSSPDEHINIDLRYADPSTIPSPTPANIQQRHSLHSLPR